MSDSFDGGPPATSSFQRPEPRHVPDYLVWSLFVTVLCCQPLGLAGVVYSVLASSKKSAGDYDGAIADAALAKKWIKIGAIVGGILVVLVILLYVVAGAAAIFGSDDNSTSP